MTISPIYQRLVLSLSDLNIVAFSSSRLILSSYNNYGKFAGENINGIMDIDERNREF